YADGAPHVILFQYVSPAGGGVADFNIDDMTLDVVCPQSSLQFSAANYNVGEGDGSATITVTRTGDTSAAATVNFASSDGTAVQRKDYQVASGTISFAAGETSKTLSVLIVDNNYVDGNRTFSLTLTNASGGTLGTPNPATVTIIDNDSVPPTTNPLD